MVNTGNIVVLGDSYSTFENYIPNGYAAWYFGYQVEYTDVDKVEQTWWYALAQETGGKILLNNSWSGSTVGNTGYDGVDATCSSFITRFDELAEKGFFQENTVDTLFIFGGDDPNGYLRCPKGDPRRASPFSTARANQWVQVNPSGTTKRSTPNWCASFRW